MDTPPSLPPGKILASEEFLGETAYAVKHDGSVDRIELNILTRDQNYTYSERDIVIHVPMTSDIFTLPVQDVSEAVDRDKYRQVEGSERDETVAYCYRCVTPERGEILEIKTNHNFHIHEYCLTQIRQAVEKLISKNSEQLVVNSLD